MKGYSIFAVKDLKGMFSKTPKFKVLCFSEDMVSDLAGRFLHILVSHPTMKNIELHVGSNDVAKQRSKMSKRDFNALLNTVSSLGPYY